MERSQVVSDTVLNLLGVRHCLCKTSPVPAFLRSLSHPLVHSLSGTCHWRTVSWTRQPPCLFLKSWSKMTPSCLQLLLVRHLVTSLWKGIKSPGTESEGKLLWFVPSCDWSVSRCDFPKGNCEGLSAPAHGGAVWAAVFVLTLLQRCWTAGKWLDFNTGTGRSWKFLISRNGHCRPLLTSTQ